MLVPGDMDGGPHQAIRPGEEWKASFRVNQPAATAWYHPHGLGNTAIQVYRGLAGLFIVDDLESEKLNLPDKYGENDVPLIVQGRRFADDGTLLYLTGMRDIMNSMTGNTILVNGVINMFLDVGTAKYRFRILNGSNARTYEFRLSDGGSFYQIATDAGLVEKPVKLKSLVLSAGERAEIIIDFSKYKTGKRVSLVSDSFEIIVFNINKETTDSIKIPEKLAGIDRLKIADSARSRVFSMEGSGHMVSINSRRMEMNRIDEYMKYGDTETWIITNTSRGMMGMGMTGNAIHNFHAHGVHFLILDRNGNPPYPEERGWKDTVLVAPGDEARVITRFLYKGVFMYHCHILEHEDNGMMGQFKVE